MKRLLLVLLLVSAPASAGWTLVDSNEGARSSTYADIATIRRQDSSVTMWTLVDFKNARRAPYGPEYLSLKAQQEFDCEGRRARVLDVAMHAGPMGDEEVVSTHAGPDEWEPVPSASVSEALWKIACQKP
jgi:hypothetical protein